MSRDFKVLVAFRLGATSWEGAALQTCGPMQATTKVI